MEVEFAKWKSRNRSREIRHVEGSLTRTEHVKLCDQACDEPEIGWKFADTGCIDTYTLARS